MTTHVNPIVSFEKCELDTFPAWVARWPQPRHLKERLAMLDVLPHRGCATLEPQICFLVGLIADQPKGLGPDMTRDLITTKATTLLPEFAFHDDDADAIYQGDGHLLFAEVLQTLMTARTDVQRIDSFLSSEEGRRGFSETIDSCLRCLAEAAWPPPNRPTSLNSTWIRRAITMHMELFVELLCCFGYFELIEDMGPATLKRLDGVVTKSGLTFAQALFERRGNDHEQRAARHLLYLQHKCAYLKKKR